MARHISGLSRNALALTLLAVIALIGLVAAVFLSREPAHERGPT